MSTHHASAFKRSLAIAGRSDIESELGSLVKHWMLPCFANVVDVFLFIG